MNMAAPRCFCAFVCHRTEKNIYVCYRYPTGTSVCLFHLHEENLPHYLEKNVHPMPKDCESCLFTMTVQMKEYFAPCRLRAVRCFCHEVARLAQSQRDNKRHGSFFFSCPNWNNSVKSCSFFFWADEYRTDVDLLESPETIKATSNECVICLSEARVMMIVPCNHLCCCQGCARQIRDVCPICRQRIRSFQRVYLV